MIHFKFPQAYIKKKDLMSEISQKPTKCAASKKFLQNHESKTYSPNIRLSKKYFLGPKLIQQINSFR